MDDVARAAGVGKGTLFRRFGELLLASQPGTPGGRFRPGPYASYHLFISSLLREAAPHLDPDYTAEALLATLGAELVAYLREDREMPLEQIAAGFEQLVRALVD